MAYPSPFVPRDSLVPQGEVLDWHGDHPYTNYRQLLKSLQALDYSVEILRGPWTCFDASAYGILLVVDPEEEFLDEEITKLQDDLKHRGLSLLLIPDWYDEVSLATLRYKDEATTTLWYPVAAGSNIPGVNRLLSPFSAAIGIQTFVGKFNFNGSTLNYLSGNTVARWPNGGHVLRVHSGDIKPVRTAKLRGQTSTTQIVAAFVDLSKTQADGLGGGKIAVYGDSNCFDASPRPSFAACSSILNTLLAFVSNGSFPKLGNGAQINRLMESFEAPGLLQVSAQQPTKEELQQMEVDRLGRAWEFSRCVCNYALRCAITRMSFEVAADESAYE